MKKHINFQKTTDSKITEKVLTPEACDFLAFLHRRFDQSRTELLDPDMAIIKPLDLERYPVCSPKAIPLTFLPHNNVAGVF